MPAIRATGAVVLRLQRRGRSGPGQQRRFGRLLLGQQRVVKLLADPGSVAEIGQTHHAGAALQGVERAPQDGELLQIGRIARERRHGAARALEHLAGFLEKHLAHVVGALPFLLLLACPMMHLMHGHGGHGGHGSHAQTPRRTNSDKE